MRLTLLTLLLVLSTTAFSEELYLYTGAVSHHPSGLDEGVTNESHNLLAVEYKSFMAGVYDNSFDDRTVFAAYHWHTQVRDANIQLGLQLGVNWGYRGQCFVAPDSAADPDPTLCPEFAATIAYTKWRAEPWVGLRGPIPVLGLRWKFEIKE